MTGFVDCRECKTECPRADGNHGYTFCSCFTPKKKPMTNADRIRAMSDEDLAVFLDTIWDISAIARQKGTGDTLHWLQQLVKEDVHA